MAASGSIVSLPLAAVDQVNASSLAGARTEYELWNKILGNNQAPLILASLPITAAAVLEGLLAYELTLADSAAAYGRIGLEPPSP